MNLTTKGKYAVTAALDLAINENNVSFSKIADVAKRQSIPSSYLEQIFNNLRKADILTASRGPKGGFKLSRSSEDIMIGEIITAVEKRMDATQCSGEGNCNAGSKCVAHNLWTELNENINSFLMKKSLRDVLNSRTEDPSVKDKFLIATG
tara:strand:+ start:34 stop:483 length:450 start_codon:yes stop_codon:yes gene_type:complete